MVHLCDVCKTADAKIYCFGDQAVLCPSCDQSLHAGKPSKKHERVKLQTDDENANCDICQDAKAVLFCSEDRALLCRRCDVMIHSANEYVAKHHRFLLSGTAVGLKALDSGGSTPDPGSAKRPYSLRNASTNGVGERDLWSTNSERSSWRNGSENVTADRVEPNFGQASNSHQGSQPSLIGMSNGSGFARAPSLTGASLLSPFGNGGDGMKENASRPGATQAGAGPTHASWGPGWGTTSDLTRPDSSDLTLASELLGIPTATGFNAKDVDAAYIFDDGIDFETGLSSLLEVPNMDFQSFDDPITVYGNTSLQDVPGAPVKTFEQSPTDGLVPNYQAGSGSGSPATKRQKL